MKTKLKFTAILLIILTIILAIGLQLISSAVKAGDTVRVRGASHYSVRKADGYSRYGLCWLDEDNLEAYCVTKGIQAYGGYTRLGGEDRMFYWNIAKTKTQLEKMRYVASYGDTVKIVQNGDDGAKQVAFWAVKYGWTGNYCSWYNIWSGYQAESDKIIKEATDYANKITTVYDGDYHNAKPTITKSSDTIAEQTSDGYKIGPLSIKYDDMICSITSIKAYSDSNAEISIKGYVDEAGKAISGMPKSDSKFYILINNKSTTKIKIVADYKYAFCTGTKLYVAEDLGGQWQVIVAESEPETGSVETEIETRDANYLIRLYKADAYTKTRLRDAKFKYKVTKGGKTTQGGEEFTFPNTLTGYVEPKETITYEITEIKSPEGYRKLDGSVFITVTGKSDGTADIKVSKSTLSYTAISPETYYELETDGDIKSLELTTEQLQKKRIDTTKTKTGARLTIFNEKKTQESEYVLNFEKYDNTFNKPINATFSVKINDEEAQTVKTSGGKFTIRYSTKRKATDTIVITETETSDNTKYKVLKNPITIKVSKTKETIDGAITFVANKITVSGNGVENKTYETTVTEQNGKKIAVIKDNIAIKIEDEVIMEGKYNININKVDGATDSLLAGATFEVSVNGSKLGEYTTNANGRFNTPVEVRTSTASDDTIVLKETKAPANYEQLQGQLTLKVTKEANEAKWAYIPKTIQVTENFKNEKGNTIESTTTFNENSALINIKVQNERKKIKLSGYVFEDDGQGKESKLNGQKDGNEKFIEGIKVTLHTRDGATVAETKTDSNGYYEFEIPAGPDYYVEFTYNGYNYQHTTYTTWTGNGNPLTSNSTETESARKNLNAKLENITPNMTVDGVKIDNTINEKGPTYIDDELYRISAYTGGYGNARDIKYYNTTSEYINLGITKRETADLALFKDVYSARTEIKGYTQTYEYNKRELTKDDNGNKYWDISQRASDVSYYKDNYTRELQKADYNYTDADENRNLKLYVTYVIDIRNQSGVLDTKVRGISEYYDEDYTFVNAYIGDRRGNKTADVTVSEESIAPVGGYKQRTITGLDNEMLKSSSDMYVYVTFSVGTGKNIKLDNDKGKGNMAEILGYSTYYGEESKLEVPNKGNSATYDQYKEGDVAGRVDVDSNPGNATSINESTFEDDTDRSPFIRIVLNENARTTTGYVWEDERNVDSASAKVGNGIRDNGETLIDGITVELWDKDTNTIAKIWNGSEWIDARTTTHDGGQYSFDGFVPGNYYVKFIYGNGENTKYNGQDYKSTIYVGTKEDIGFDINNPDNDDRIVETQTPYSDARDIYGNADTPGTRAYVNNLYAGEMINTRVKDRAAKIKEAYIEAKTGIINIFIEKGGNNISGLSGTEKLEYTMRDIDFGLVKRPEAEISLRKEVENLKVTLANGNTLFDFTPGQNVPTSNLIWIQKDVGGTRSNGKIQLTMDEELMHGATIKVTYKITATNTGEYDYNTNEFYYAGTNNQNARAVATKVGKVIDYAGASGSDDSNKSRNNLKFSQNDQVSGSNWTAVTAAQMLSDGLVDSSLENTVKQYDTILVSDFSKDLTPGETDAKTLVLSQVISSSSSEDKTYGNMAELISFENGIGRRLTTTVGSQNPDSAISEIDADLAEEIIILPPFGENRVYYVLGLGIAIITLAGVVIIRKMVRKK